MDEIETWAERYEFNENPFKVIHSIVLTKNSQTFRGHQPGEVLCLGVDCEYRQGVWLTRVIFGPVPKGTGRIYYDRDFKKLDRMTIVLSPHGDCKGRV